LVIWAVFVPIGAVGIFQEILMAKDVSDYQSPPHKIIAFLRQGRDKLRVKYTELKREFRVCENQVRAVSKSRQTWRERALAAEAQLRELERRELKKSP
jgi:hypothetical protein